MAIHTNITPLAAFEAPCETMASNAFVTVLRALANFIQAERDYEGVCYSRDPALQMWERDAELAQEALTTALHDFHDAPEEVREDRPLRRMALTIDSMLGNEVPGKARRMYREMQLTFFARFQARGIGATAMHRNGLLIHARHLTAAMVALPLFDSSDVGKQDSGPGGLSPAF